MSPEPFPLSAGAAADGEVAAPWGWARTLGLAVLVTVPLALVGFFPVVFAASGLGGFGAARGWWPGNAFDAGALSLMLLGLVLLGALVAIGVGTINGLTIGQPAARRRVLWLVAGAMAAWVVWIAVQPAL